MKSLFEELGGTYHQEGNYFLPDLSLPETAPVGIWGCGPAWSGYG